MLDNAYRTYIRLEAVLSPRKLYSFYITDAQAAGLKAIKRAEDITESEQIRQALNAWLRKWQRKGVTIKAERKRGRTRQHS
jgi:hypothetical protein